VGFLNHSVCLNLAPFSRIASSGNKMTNGPVTKEACVKWSRHNCTLAADRAGDDNKFSDVFSHAFYCGVCRTWSSTCCAVVQSALPAAGRATTTVTVTTCALSVRSATPSARTCEPATVCILVAHSRPFSSVHISSEQDVVTCPVQMR